MIWKKFVGKALVLKDPTELEIFYQDFVGNALVLVNPTKLKIFWHHLKYSKITVWIVMPHFWALILENEFQPRGFWKCRAPTCFFFQIWDILKESETEIQVWWNINGLLHENGPWIPILNRLSYGTVKKI